MSTGRPDYYAVLGVPRDADRDALRAAYRALATRFHPDKNPARDSTERFKALVEAWSVLRDPARRAAYDTGTSIETPVEPSNGLAEAVGGVVDTLFGIKDRRAVAGRNRRYRLRVPFADAMRGTDQRLVLPDDLPCDACDGRGFPPETIPEICDRCLGQGELQARPFIRATLVACPDCGGRGYTVPFDCPDCNGHGFVRHEKTWELSLQPGVEDGQKLRIRGAGEPGRHGGDAGDCIVEVTVDRHRALKRAGADVTVTRPIPLFTALTGGTVDVPTIRGPRSIRIPAGSRDQDTLRMPGYGVGGEPPGDQLVTLEVEPPVALDQAARAHLEAAAQAIGPGAFPRSHAFMADEDADG